MRRDTVIVADIVEAAKRIVEYLGTMTREEFLGDRKTQAAVVHEIVIMGEAASQLPLEFRASLSELPWADMIQLRNFYIHAYHRVDYRRVWRAATVQSPRIANALAPLIEDAEEAE